MEHCEINRCDENRLEEFELDGKNFLYIDFSGIKTNEGLLAQAELVKPVVAKYPLNSLYTITNIDNVKFDTKTKQIALDYLKHNKPFVKYGVIIGIDGIKKLLATEFMRLSGRKNLFFTFSKEKAIELLSQRF
ncbi:MAG: hypothetical protein LBH42_04255 [Treponema sp.]|nr:hypothetical protein [Treponema sp.]